MPNIDIISPTNYYDRMLMELQHKASVFVFSAKIIRVI